MLRTARIAATIALVPAALLPAAGERADARGQRVPGGDVFTRLAGATLTDEEVIMVGNVDALALLVPAQGARTGPTQPPTSARLGAYLPAEGAAEEAARKLRALGFEVHPGGPIALTIRAPAATFGRVFAMELEIAGEGTGPRVAAKTPAVIPPELAQHVGRIVFPTPAEPFP